MKLKQFTFTLLTVCLAIVFGPKAAVEAASLTTIASGFDNARGLTYGPDGNLYLSETGKGGDGQCQPSPSTQFENICAGNTGAVVKISPDGSRVEPVISNFESLALQPSQEQGAGPETLKFDSSGNAYLATGFAGNPANRDLELNALASTVEYPSQQSVVSPPVSPEDVLGTTTLGKLYQTNLTTGELTEVADLSKAELLNNPDGGDVISNPYDMVIKGDTAYITDGGANVVWNVKLDGSSVTSTPLPTEVVSNLVYPPSGPPGEAPGGQENPPAGQTGQDAIPGVPAESEAAPDGPPPGAAPTQAELQSVPTGIDVGPDGAVYVGELKGFPYPEGEARVYRIGEDGTPEVYAEGFTQITDIKFDKDGNLLVLQFADEPQWVGGTSIADLPGSLIKLAPDGTRTTLVAAGEGLASAAGLAIGENNEIYVTNQGVGPGVGEVVRIDDVESVPEPSSMLGLLAFGALGGGTWLKRKRQQQAAE